MTSFQIKRESKRKQQQTTIEEYFDQVVRLSLYSSLLHWILQFNGNKREEK